MNRRHRIAVAIGLASLGAVMLASCSSTSSTSSSSAAASETVVGGTTECTKEAVGPAATEAAKALGSADNVFTFEDLQCSNGWAVASGIVGTGETAADRPNGAPTSFVFQAEGQFWVPQDKEKVCGSDPASETAPPDATIPADLYLAGCASG